MKIEHIRWKQNVPANGIDPCKGHKALEKIRETKGLTDDTVVESARPKNHTLHKWFEWDDSAAAREHRRSQARSLLRSIEVVYEEAPENPVRAFQVDVKESSRNEKRTSYETTVNVLSKPESRDRLIAEAIREAMSFRRRFKMLHELEMVMEAIDKTLVKLGDS